MPTKHKVTHAPPDCEDNTLGLAPAVLAKRVVNKQNTWCPVQDPLLVDYDPWCDPYKPRTVTHKDVFSAHCYIKDRIAATPLLKSNRCNIVNMDLHFKLENVHKTGSFHERGAIYALHMLSADEIEGGVYTASTGNWALAFANAGHKIGIRVVTVVPTTINNNTVEKLRRIGARVIVFGKTLTEARKRALDIIKDKGVGTYISGYDHPHVIAGAGGIAIEILDQLPNTDAILIPVGGGGLLAGIIAAVKKLKPDTLIYGVEPDDSCCFFKALDNERPYITDVGNYLAVPQAGYNTFHTARSLIDKMILVRESWISRAMLQTIEEERFVAEFAGATALAAILAEPNIVPELRDKTVVCIVSGGNVDNIRLPQALKYGMALEGRLVIMQVALEEGNEQEHCNVLKIIANIGCNIIYYDIEHKWFSADDVNKFYVSVLCETRGLQHSCTLKHVMEKLFPNKCEFSDIPFCSTTKCPCFPKMGPHFQ